MGSTLTGWAGWAEVADEDDDEEDDDDEEEDDVEEAVSVVASVAPPNFRTSLLNLISKTLSLLKGTDIPTITPGLLQMSLTSAPGSLLFGFSVVSIFLFEFQILA